MAKTYPSSNNFMGGVQSYPKLPTIQSGYYFGYCVNYRDDPQAITLYPGAVKESGSVVTDLLMWGTQLPNTEDSYYYGNTGNIYHRNFQGGWQNLHTAQGAHGNGLDYFFGDDYLYYAQDQTFGRFGPVAWAPQLVEGWLSASINQTLWNLNYAQGEATQQVGQLTISNPANDTAGPQVQSYQNFQVANQRMVVQAISVGNQALTSLQYIYALLPDLSGNNALILSVKGNTIKAQKQIAGVITDIASTAYSSTTMKYFAIGEQDGTIYFDTSQDGVSFTNLGTLTNPFNTTNLFIAFQVITTSNEASATSGIYGPITLQSRFGTPQFVDNFLQAQGGVPLNTASVQLLSASTQYAHAADSASLSITSDLTLETFFKANTLPATSSSMTLVGKWDEALSHRSYKMDLFGVSGFFGDGSDGSKTISVNTTDAPIDSSCHGTAGTQALAATNASFAAGKPILIIQMQGANAGQWERNTIQSYTTGVITTTTPLKNTYNSFGTETAQVIQLPQYTNVTVNTGVTWTAKAWNGTVGGILVFLANGTVTVTGTISATGKGFLGGITSSGDNGWQGSGISGTTAQSTTANTNGGGGGVFAKTTGGVGGSVSGANDLSTMTLGGAGGAGNNGPTGGNGGGIVFIMGVTLSVTGSVIAAGQQGDAGSFNNAAGGSGAGGSVLLKAQTATLGTALITASGAAGRSGGWTGAGAGGGGGNGTAGATGTTTLSGAGGDGRIVLDYLTSFTGTTTPTLNSIQDSTLVTTTTIQARLGISNDGTSSEYLTQNLPTLATGVWNRLSISWIAALSTASFYLNGVLIGTATGTKTAIQDNVSLLTVGANDGGSGIANYFNGLLNDMRIWNAALSAGTIATNNLQQIPTNSPNLQAYYTFNSTLNDGTANANNLTGVNTPTYTSDVPFPAPTTRLDIDQSFTTTGHTYTLPTAISESASDMLPFTPTLDPQKSVDFNISAKGTGNWTVYVHDQQNRLIAQKTIANASLQASGYQEFIFEVPWRIVIGKTYHFHLISSVNDGTVVTSVASNFSNADFHTYYGFLVTDTQFHPITPFLNFIAIGNERYVAKWDGAFYTANAIAFPTGWRVRCFGTWREYLAIGVWKGPDITAFTHGRVYFWDGIAPTFNFFIDVPDGQINALWGKNTDLFMVAGYRGDIVDYQGNYFFDTGNSQSNKLRFVPKRATSDTIEVFPGAFNYYRNLLQIGFAGISNSTTIGRGVYSLGTYDPKLPETLSLDYPISTGNMGSTVSIGLVFPVGDKLIIGWQDGSATGADVIDFANNPAPHGRIEMMISDFSGIWHYKKDSQIRADFLSLRSGESVGVDYNLDRGGWVSGTPDATVGDTFVKTSNIQGRPREIQIGFDLYATGTTSPTLLGITEEHDELESEQQF